jgi:hypothetical protein
MGNQLRPGPRVNQPSCHLQQYPDQVQRLAVVEYLGKL